MKKILSPKIDVVFRMLFGEQKHERITKKLIEDVIEEKVEKIELEQTPYLWGNQADDKLGIIDVRATINDKNPIDIEMQILNNHDIEKRILFYWSKLYLKQIERAKNDLKTSDYKWKVTEITQEFLLAERKSNTSCNRSSMGKRTS